VGCGVWDVGLRVWGVELRVDTSLGGVQRVADVERHTHEVGGLVLRPEFRITYPYTAHCMRVCSAKGEWGLFSLPRSLSISLSLADSLSRR
jgi:hypothetical protein